MAARLPNLLDLDLAAGEARDHASLMVALVEGMLTDVLRERDDEVTLDREQARALQFAAMGTVAAVRAIVKLYEDAHEHAAASRQGGA